MDAKCNFILCFFLKKAIMWLFEISFREHKTDFSPLMYMEEIQILRDFMTKTSRK